MIQDKVNLLRHLKITGCKICQLLRQSFPSTHRHCMRSEGKKSKIYVSIKRKQVCLLQTTLGQRPRTSIRRQEYIYLFLVGITAHTTAQEILKPMLNTIELCSVFVFHHSHLSLGVLPGLYCTFSCCTLELPFATVPIKTF